MTFGGYGMPEEMNAWADACNCARGRLGHTTLGGAGYTNGISNKEYCFMIYDLSKEDCLAFKLRFPDVKVHVSNQYSYD
jgi:hypothetical protein